MSVMECQLTQKCAVLRSVLHVVPVAVEVPPQEVEEVTKEATYVVQHLALDRLGTCVHSVTFGTRNKHQNAQHVGSVLPSTATTACN